MKSILGSWVGKNLHIVLRSSPPTPLEGKVLELDHAGIMIDVLRTPTFVPVTSILYMSVRENEE
jgi:hypothetical protein